MEKYFIVLNVAAIALLTRTFIDMFQNIQRIQAGLIKERATIVEENKTK